MTSEESFFVRISPQQGALARAVLALIYSSCDDKKDGHFNEYQIQVMSVWILIFYRFNHGV